MAFVLGQRSLDRLKGVHPDLVKVVKRAIEITPIDFTVLEGLRTVERQKKLVAQGASKTTKSRHITGHAVDLAAVIDGQIRWDWALYLQVATAVQQASSELKIPIRWGGTWKLLSDTPAITSKVLSRSFPDGPHFELPAKAYP